MENLIKIDDLGVPLFLETPIYTPEVHDSETCFYFCGVYLLSFNGTSKFNIAPEV